MSSKIWIATIAAVLPCMAIAQQTGAQAQGNAAAQGGASVQRGNGAAVQSQSAATGNASGTVGHGDKQLSAGSGAMTNAVLSGSLDSKKARPGDPVTAKTAEPAQTPDGVAIPKGTKLLGRVTEAKAAGKGEGESALGFTFDRAVLKDGREVPFQATVRALAAADGAASTSRDAGGMTSGGASAAGGAAGGARGAVGGLGATAGGAVGGALGTTGSITRGAVGSSVGATGNVLAGSTGSVGGVTSRGVLSSDSQGVFGLRGVNLTQNAAGSGSIVTSAGRSVQLDSGTRMLLSVERGATESASAAGSGSAAAAGGGSPKGNETKAQQR